MKVDSFTKNLVDTVRLVAVAGCVYIGIHELLHTLRVSNGVIWLASLGSTFFLLRGPVILTRRKVGLAIYRSPDPLFWAAFPVFAASGFFASAGIWPVQVLAIWFAAMLFAMGSRRTRDRYFAKAERAVTAQICPIHGKKAFFELRMDGNRPYMWVAGCCEEAKETAKAAAQEVFCH
jgi:hypothetical protein